jgi:hypothetical protein
MIRFGSKPQSLSQSRKKWTMIDHSTSLNSTETWHTSSWRRQTWRIYACKSIDRLNIDFLSRLIQRSRILCKSARLMSESNAITLNLIDFRETMTTAFSSSLLETWTSSSRERLFVIEITSINVCTTLSNATIIMRCFFRYLRSFILILWKRRVFRFVMCREYLIWINAINLEIS